MAIASILINLTCLLIMGFSKELQKYEYFLVFVQTLHDFLVVGVLRSVLSGAELLNSMYYTCKWRRDILESYPKKWSLSHQNHNHLSLILSNTVHAHS